jgi:uncharacterized protein YbjT (DUF2867 family)
MATTPRPSGAVATISARRRRRDPRTACRPAGVEVVRGDFFRPETWAALTGVERVHLLPLAADIPFEEQDPAEARTQWIPDGYPPAFVDCISRSGRIRPATRTR